MRRHLLRADRPVEGIELPADQPFPGRADAHHEGEGKRPSLRVSMNFYAPAERAYVMGG